MSTQAAATPGTLVVERVFPHPPAKLWRALTESPLLAQWMMSNDFAPVVGRKFQFRNEPKPNLERHRRLRGPDRRSLETALL